MCGILAYYQRFAAQPLTREIFDVMLSQLARRGPDDRSVYIHDRVGLGHTRLSIIDLTSGRQPMFNEEGNVACILNGEIYNFLELRQELIARGHAFKSASDTEVIVHLYEEVGEQVFSRLDGMFAIAIYDQRRECLLVARDRIGEKPLYYHDSPGFFLCGSELKALLKYPALSREIDVEALGSYLYSLYVPAPLSIFKSVRKLEPGQFMTVNRDGVRISSFWRPTIHVERSIDEAQAIEGLRDRLSESVRSKLIADVPLGVFLSGGIDSSAVVAFMARHATSRIKTFSVGFGTQLDELPFARQVAERYGTDHTEIMVESRLSDEVPCVAAYYDEPFADTSSVPTYVISREARKHVKVALTGDGGDELFAGYESYIGQKYYSQYRLVGRLAGMIDAGASRSIGRTLLDGVYPLPGNAGAYGRWLDTRRYFTSNEIRTLVKRDLRVEAHFAESAGRLSIAAGDPLSAAFQHDINFYLPDDLLKKVDMAAMAHGLECRAPFLDHRLVEFALSIPPRLKLRNNVSKYLLRKAMAPDLPDGIAWREKQGFGAPIAAWLGGELKPLVDDVLDSDARVYSLLDRSAVRSILREQQAGARTVDWRRPFRLWILLMLELWLRNYANQA
jgi:asparagine synthase (glutamine-hydrolysing)